MISKTEQKYLIELDNMIKEGVTLSKAALARRLGNSPTSVRPDRMPTLIARFEEAKAKQNDSTSTKSALSQEKQRKQDYKKKYRQYKADYHKALSKIVCLEAQVWELKKDIARLMGNKVVDLSQYQEKNY